MEFTVTKSDLVRELGLSQGVVEKKTTIPILSNVLVEADGEKIVLTATDLELGIRCSCTARVSKPGAGTIPARRLLDYVRLLPEADISVKIGDNQWANLLCGRSRTRIAGMSRESFPELPAMPEVLAEIPISVLTSMIGRTIFAISSEESRFTLNGALVVLRENGVTMVATDGHRLAMTETVIELPEVRGTYRALLPRKAMSEVLKLGQESDLDAPLKFSGDDNHLFFQLGQRLLISRKLTGNFPDYERVLPKEHANSVALGRDELRASIERVSQFSDERSHAVRLRVSPGELRIYSSLSETGESEESLPVEYGGPQVEIGFNAQYLIDFLRAVPTDAVTFSFRDAQSAGEMQPSGGVEGQVYRYVIMPMRV
ncbi:MAG: DNA polymerase III subunit beta [Acidobacteria bacterium]|nr:DNA polymerase III subunit beta [Acidobacteriota bacterium]MBI3281559.1 DNA polymerase III subunit beta [Acidobacteriota bacterium]